MLSIFCITSMVLVLQEPAPVESTLPTVRTASAQDADSVSQESVTPESVTPEVPKRLWRTPSELDKDLVSLESSHNTVKISTIGYSRNGLPLRVIRIARSGETPIDERSSILLVAGIDGDHILGSEVAIDMVDELLAREEEETKNLFEHHALYIIPQVNPDAAELFFAPIRTAQRRNLRPVDNDHDGAIDEDGGDDLNGDGMITMMRVPNLEKATHLPDPDESRLDIKPDALKGQATQYLLYTEGIDNDEDGQYNEDGIGGVDLNKNFLHGYTYHGDGAGPWQLSEPESKALIDYVLGHQRIAAIIVYGAHDTLSKPFSEGGSNQAGAPKKLDSGDVGFYKQISEKFVELTSLKNVPQPNWNGSFVAWAYAQYGVPAFSTPLWSRPEPEKEEAGDQENGKDATQGEDTKDDKNVGEGGEGEEGGFRRGGGSRRGGGGRPGGGAGRPSGGGRPGGGAGRPSGGGAGRPSGGGAGRPGGGSADASDSEDTSGLTPSSVGDISQETLDELLKAAEAAGYPVTDEMMAEMTPERVERFAKMSGVTIRRVKSTNSDKKNSGDETKWLAYSDDVRNGEGFVEWTSFEHPQLGIVEIGGWAPYFKTVPPTDVIEDTTKVQADFIIDLAGKLPSVHLGTPSFKELGNGLWEVKISVSNDGWLPSGTAMARRNRRARPYVISIEVPNDTILTGQKVNRIWALSGGGTRKWYRWIIKGKPHDSLQITLFSEKFGTETISPTLQDTNGGDK